MHNDAALILAYFTKLKKKFPKPKSKYTQIVYSYLLLPGAEKEIYRRIGDITISMKACGNLKLPELMGIIRNE